MLSWLGDPASARRQLKDAALIRFRGRLRNAGAGDEQEAAALAEMRTALAGVTVEECPTPDEYAEAVEDAARRVERRYLR